jgi:hypothetical protein
VNDIHRCYGERDIAGFFVIRQTIEKNWCVSTPDQRTGGFFRSMDEAHRFARNEARNHARAEVIVVNDAGLDIEVFDDARLASSLHVDDAGLSPARSSLQELPE